MDPHQRYAPLIHIIQNANNIDSDFVYEEFVKDLYNVPWYLIYDLRNVDLKLLFLNTNTLYDLTLHAELHRPYAPLRFVARGESVPFFKYFLARSVRDSFHFGLSAVIAVYCALCFISCEYPGLVGHPLLPLSISVLVSPYFFYCPASTLPLFYRTSFPNVF